MKKEKILILLAVFLAAFGTIANEIIAATSLTHIIGASVFYFSLVIGVYLAALGLGGWLSSKISDEKTLTSLVIIEIILSFTAGALAVFYYFLYALSFAWLNQQTFFGLGGIILKMGLAEIFFNVIALSYLFVLGVLDGYELPLASRFLSFKEELKEALGKAFFWDYGGGLIASIFLPILFFPLLGVVGTSFLNGFLTAVAGLIFFLIYKKGRSFLNRDVFLISFLTLGLIFNFVCLVLSKPIVSFFQQKIYLNQKIIYLKHSPYQQIVYTQTAEGKVRLYLDGNLQFEQGDWGKFYHESFVHPAFLINPSAKKILVLGGGDGLALREVLKYPVKEVTLVDIDKDIVDSAKNLKFMTEINNNSFWDKRVKVIIGDAFKFVERDKNKYDLIFVDFPDPTDDSLSRLYSQEFYSLTKKRLKNDGLMIVQSSSYEDPTHLTILKTLAQNFYTLSYHPPIFSSFEQNFYNFGFTMASSYPINQEMITKKKINVDTEILKTSNLKSLFLSFSKMKRKKFFTFKPRTNSLFFPIIVGTQGDIFFNKYLESLSQKRQKVLAEKLFTINFPQSINIENYEN